MDQFVEEIHNDAKSKGWWETCEKGIAKEKHPDEIRMLIVSEIAEATEEVRSKRSPIYQWCDQGHLVKLFPNSPDWQVTRKPEGEAVELADAVIRILDYYGAKGWHIDHHMNDHVGLFESDNALVHHLQFVKFISIAEGADEEKNLGRVVVLIKDYFEKKGWDLEKTMRLKIDFNKTRPFRHGGKAH